MPFEERVQKGLCHMNCQVKVGFRVTLVSLLEMGEKTIKICLHRLPELIGCPEGNQVETAIFLKPALHCSWSNGFMENKLPNYFSRACKK